MGCKRGWAGYVGAFVWMAGFLLAAAAAAAEPLGAEQADRIRIRQHLARVESQLRQTAAVPLTPETRAERSRLLDELHRYWRAGIFPVNSRHPLQRRPYFIDDAGRACAVGALVQSSGYEALAERIDQRFHTDYVPDMADAELLAWAEAHGFSVAELALIQPTYCNCDGWNGNFEPGSAGAGGAEPLDGAAYFQPVCGSNGLSYWNQCIAELCGGVTVTAAGECAHEPPCELCGTGNKYAVVAECDSTGICNGIDSQPDVAPVNQEVAAHWVELQAAECRAPQYSLEGFEPDEFWQPSHAVQEYWQCSGGGEASAGEPATAGAGAASSNGGQSSGDSGASGLAEQPRPRASDHPSGGGCSSARVPLSGSFGLGAMIAALALVRRRAGFSR